MATTTSFNLAPMPKWYIADLTGKPLGGGTMSTFSSLDNTTFKFIFQDPGGTLPWPDPVFFDLNGSQGPFYWEFDTANPDDLYYIEVRDAQGNLQWTIDNFTPPGGGGGGGVITVARNIQNLIVNNIMWRNLGTTPVTSTVQTLLAPGPHAWLTNKSTNSAGTYTGSDIYFLKNNASATDTVSFPRFSAGVTPFTGDVTPIDYFNYTCTLSGSAEVVKIVQYPITHSIQNLSSQTITVSIWARINTPSNGTNITLQLFQFTGDGGSPVASVTTVIQVINLSSSWTKYGPFTVAIPTVAALTPLGSCGNDALFLQVLLPLNMTCNIDFTKLSVYIGNISPQQDYITYDMIDGVINAPRTGDIRTSINNFVPFGWLFMDDGTIGDSSSGATNRSNVDTFPLYNQIYNSVADTWAPVTGGRGADAVADFTAHKSIRLTRALGRVFAGTLNTEVIQTFTADNTTDILTLSTTANFYTGVPIQLNVNSPGGTLPTGLELNTTYYVINLSSTTIKLAISMVDAIAGTPVTFSDDGSPTNNVQVTPYQLGQFVGEETHVLTINEMPAHTHDVPQSDSIGAPDTPLSASGSNPAVTTTSTGGGDEHNNLQPTTYMNVFIKL